MCSTINNWFCGQLTSRTSSRESSKHLMCIFFIWPSGCPSEIIAITVPLFRWGPVSSFGWGRSASMWESQDVNPGRSDARAWAVIIHYSLSVKMTLVLGHLHQQPPGRCVERVVVGGEGTVWQGPIRWKKGVTQSKFFQVIGKLTNRKKSGRRTHHNFSKQNIILGGRLLKDPKIRWISYSQGGKNRQRERMRFQKGKAGPGQKSKLWETIDANGCSFHKRHTFPWKYSG